MQQEKEQQEKPRKQPFSDALEKLIHLVFDGISEVITIEGRPILIKVKGRFHSLKKPLVYDAWALDIKGGAEGKGKGFLGINGATKEALLRLVEEMYNRGLLAP
jgi:hypothetical protein